MRILLALLVIAACGDDEVDPITKITGPRIIALTTEPSVLALESEVQLVTFTVDAGGPRTGGRPVTAVRMRACASWTLVGDPSRDCTGDLAVDLAIDADGSARITADALEASLPPPPGLDAASATWSAALAAGIPLRVPIIAEVDVDGQTLIARRDVEVVEAGVARKNPRVVDVQFDGQPRTLLQSNQPYTLTAMIAPDSLDDSLEMPGTYESVTVSLYSPSGELADTDVELSSVDPGSAALPSEPTTYTTGAGGDVWLFLVTTDETSGMSVVPFSFLVD